MNGKKLLATLRLAFLAAALLLTSLSLLPRKSEAVRCDAFCGPSGPISCNFPCRRPE